MTERQFSEVERVLLHISDARTRAGVAAKNVEKDGADAYVTAALREAEHQLGALHRELTQGTYYAIPEAQSHLPM